MRPVSTPFTSMRPTAEGLTLGLRGVKIFGVEATS
jgi:hypothetical protein